MWAFLTALVSALPEIIKMVNQLSKKNKTAKQVKNDIIQINEAFKSGDSTIIDKLFTGNNKEQ
ncbi:hypothetical protein KDA08_02445 [Candidatus Saccharibacteria bacterium]|nr:hypothetical protein [Candidatus Saccharibacteria bacterium]